MIDLPVVRLYESPDQAQRALDALRRWGFEPERIAVIAGATTPAAGAPATTTTTTAPTRDESIFTALRSASIPHAQAAQYADALRRGYTLVSVRAPFGTGGLVEDMLGSGATLDASHALHRDTLLPSDVPAPLSDTLGLPTLSERGRTTSEALGLPTIIRSGRTASEALGLPTLTHPDHYTLGAPRLSDQAAPLSRMLGLPVLTRRGRTTGEALHLPEVTARGGFTFGEPSLFDSPAPFSALFGLPVLARDRVAGSAPRQPVT